MSSRSRSAELALMGGQGSPAGQWRLAAASEGAVRLRRILIGLAIALMLATCVFAAGRVLWRVISTDGGWYSYPGYAASQGRDPDENLLPPSRLPLTPPGVRSLFKWENRAFLLTDIDRAWFDLAGAGEKSIVTFGVLQWLALTALVGWSVKRATGNPWAAGAAALAVGSDVQIIFESLADLRPDIPLAVIGVGSLCCFIHFLRRRSSVSFIAGGVLIALLPLVHTTGVVPAAMMLTCVAISALIAVNGRLSKPYMLACAALVAATVGLFLAREPIMNVLIPTRVSLSSQLSGTHDLPAMLLGMAHRGLGWKLAQERERWTSYFLPGNLPQLFFLLIGLVSLLRAGWRGGAGQWAQRLWLPLGWLVGVLALTATDPHFTDSHLIPIIALGYVMAGAGWALFLEGGSQPAPRTQGVLALTLLAFLAFLGLGLRSAQAAIDVHEGVRQGVSQASVRRLLAKVFPGSGVTWAIAPTSIWLYVPRHGTPVLVDDRDDPGVIRTALWKRISVLIIDSNFLQYGWGPLTRQGVAAGWLKPIGQVGQPKDPYFMAAYRVEHGAGGM